MKTEGMNSSILEKGRERGGVMRVCVWCSVPSPMCVPPVSCSKSVAEGG